MRNLPILLLAAMLAMFACTPADEATTEDGASTTTEGGSEVADSTDDATGFAGTWEMDLTALPTPSRDELLAAGMTEEAADGMIAEWDQMHMTTNVAGDGTWSSSGYLPDEGETELVGTYTEADGKITFVVVTVNGEAAADEWSDELVMTISEDGNSLTQVFDEGSEMTGPPMVFVRA